MPTMARSMGPTTGSYMNGVIVAGSRIISAIALRTLGLQTAECTSGSLRISCASGLSRSLICFLCLASSAWTSTSCSSSSQAVSKLLCVSSSAAPAVSAGKPMSLRRWKRIGSGPPPGAFPGPPRDCFGGGDSGASISGSPSWVSSHSIARSGFIRLRTSALTARASGKPIDVRVRRAPSSTSSLKDTSADSGSSAAAAGASPRAVPSTVHQCHSTFRAFRIVVYDTPACGRAVTPVLWSASEPEAPSLSALLNSSRSAAVGFGQRMYVMQDVTTGRAFRMASPSHQCEQRKKHRARRACMQRALQAR
eukprot:m.22269 g.22269  ORF g.22269 m.22269 type:complete len:308 (-) comp3726_c0_seq1:328-1251(-)